MRICNIPNCGKKHYAKGYCYNHYVNNLYSMTEYRNNYRKYQNDYRTKRRIHKRKNCSIDGCNNKTAKKYCYKHLLRIKKNLPFDVNCRKGLFHYKWNFGSSDYPNHTLMKNNRKIKFKQHNGLCEKCGKKAKHIHHIDFSKVNHKIDNLLLLCIKCHYSLHKGRSRKSKYKKIYGMNLTEMSKKYNIGIFKLSRMEKLNKLSIFLTKQNSML